MKYLELECTITPYEPFTDIVIAYLSDAGFTMFDTSDGLLKAYIPESEYNKDEFESLSIHKADFGAAIVYELRQADDRNWNQIWEESFSPVKVDDMVAIRAQHHEPVKNVKYELVITPRMSFGTGHHATTWLMMKMMLGMDFTDKKVLDMGCGTGVLAILASKLGAESADAVDIDDNATGNATENMELNNIMNVEVHTGNAHTLVGKKYEIVLANINRNIILEDITLYNDYLLPGGELLVSGFYDNDLEKIVIAAKGTGFRTIKKLTSKNWCCALFKI